MCIELGETFELSASKCVRNSQASGIELCVVSVSASRKSFRPDRGRALNEVYRTLRTSRRATGIQPVSPVLQAY
jgi:hypothetical protein